MSNERFNNALNRVPQKVPPIWFMRQAGRYHSHYQGMKEKHTFVELCKQPELAAEVALGPVAEFDFDVSIMFSDLLFPLEALGIGLKYAPGPVLDRKLDHQVLKNLKSADEAIADLQFQKQVLQATREVLPKDKSLIGFVGGPWTLYTYAVEGSHKALMTEVKSDPTLFNGFCEKMLPLLIQNIQLQLDGGAEIVMVFDTAAGEVSPWFYKEFIYPQLQKMFNTFPNKIGYYSQKTNGDFLNDTVYADTDLAGYGIDHRLDLSRVLSSSKNGFVQGNFDQTLLFAEHDVFKKYFNAYIAPIKDLSMQQRAGWVCGLGHGVLPKTPEANVKYFVEWIRNEFDG